MCRRVRGFLLVSAPSRGQHHKAPSFAGGYCGVGARDFLPNLCALWGESFLLPLPLRSQSLVGLRLCGSRITESGICCNRTARHPSDAGALVYA